MKTIKLICLAILVFPHLVYPQIGISNPAEEPENNFIYLFNGNIILEDQDYYLNTGVLKTYHFQNGEKVDFKDVKFIKKEDGFFGVIPTRTLFGTRIYGFAKREEIGAINLFVQTKDIYNPSSNQNIKSKFWYYSNSTFGELKKVNYPNLKQDLVFETNPDLIPGNNEVLALMEKGQKKRKLAFTLLGVGLGTALIGNTLYLISPDNSFSTQRVIGISCMVIGYGGMVSAFAIKPRKYYLEAARTYNKVY